MRSAALPLLATVIAIARPTPGHACTCIIGGPEISPVDRATNVPRNAIVIVEYAGASHQETIELTVAGTAELLPIQVVVRRPNDFSGVTAFGTPASLLAPNTTYMVKAIDTFQTVTTTFTTGDEIDTEPPVFTGLRAMTPISIPYADASASAHCVAVFDGQVSGMQLDYDAAPADVAHLALEIRDRDHDLVDELTVPTSSPHTLGFKLCAPDSPRFVAGVDYCARLVAYDVAGNRAGDSSEVCETAVTCAPEPNLSGPKADERCFGATSGCSTNGENGSWLAIAASIAFAARRRDSRRATRRR
jgi:hypothetical protein